MTYAEAKAAEEAAYSRKVQEEAKLNELIDRLAPLHADLVRQHEMARNARGLWADAVIVVCARAPKEVAIPIQNIRTPPNAPPPPPPPPPPPSFQ